jgi:torulene dioxygenase
MSSAVFENAPEQRTPVDLVIRGTIPSWLSGVLYRTGPGTTRVQLTAGQTDVSESKKLDVQHWFDGLAMHHRFEIFPGGTRVSYRSRKGAEDLEERIATEGEFTTYSFGQVADPCQSIFRKFFTVFRAMREDRQSTETSPSSANVGVTLTPGMPGIKLSALPKTESPSPSSSSSSSPSGYLVSKTDANVLQVIDAESLEPLKLTSYQSIDPRLDGQFSAAHGCRDKDSGEVFNYSCKIGGRFPVYKVFKISASGKVDVLAEIKDAPASYIHSFAMTERYVVLCVWQAHFT